MTYNVLKKPDVFYIGKQDEGKAETIDIDYSAWIERYGDGVITATFQGAEDAAPYDIVLTTANGIATWTVTKANTVAAGVGKLQLNYIVNDVEAKSLIWTVRVYPSMRASGEAPDGYQDWLTALQGLSAETQQNAQNAANSATEAEGYADQAKASADSITGLTVEAETLPAGSSATASFDADTDKLSLGIPRGDKGEKGDAGQDGITPDLTIGTTETLPAGSSATATITGTKENPVLNLGIPQGTQGIQGERGGKGDTGATPDISIGTVETLNPDESATATITGTAENPVLNLGVPKGDTGVDGFSPSASVTKQDGNIVITVTDKDGTTSETLEVDDALDETSVNPVQNAAIVEAMRSMLPVDTASGSIASFPDGADNVPMLSLKAQIEPVQDLHGYDHPWPAGGGKNLLPYASKDTDSRNGVTWTKNSDGSIAFSGTCSESTSMTFVEFKLPTGDYLFSNVGSTFSYTGGNRPFVYVRDLDNALTLASIGFGQSANGISFSLSATTNIRFYAVFQSNNVVSGVLYPMIRLATETDATFAPYSNECPISGHTGVQVEKKGKNLLNTENILPVSLSSTNFVSIPLDTKIYERGRTESISVKLLGELGADKTRFALYIYDTKNNNAFYVGRDQYLTAENGYALSGLITISQSVDVQNPLALRIYAQPYTGGGVSTVNGLMISFGTATDYEPYQGETISQEFVDAQGNQLTVYGGESEIVGGKLTSRMAMVDLGTLNWTYIGKFYAPIQGAKIPATQQTVPNVLCSIYSADSYYRLVNAISDKAITIDQSGNAYVRDSSYNNATTFKAAMSGVQLCYELAEPIEYTLTPQEVRTFLGQNNIWNDTGNTEVTYRADIGKYIEKKVSA